MCVCVRACTCSTCSKINAVIAGHLQVDIRMRMLPQFRLNMRTLNVLGEPVDDAHQLGTCSVCVCVCVRVCVCVCVCV